MSINTQPAQRVLAVATVALIAAILSGCSLVESVMPQTKATRDSSGEIIGGGQADVFAIKVGDCLNEAKAGEVTDVPTVPCSQPHDEEVFYEFELTGDKYPGADEVSNQSEEGCLAQFESFVGVSYEESTLNFYPYEPTKQGWVELDDRGISCMIYDPNAQVTGSLAGVAR